MMFAVQDILINLLASVVAGTAVWLWEWTRRHRQTVRRRRFFGVQSGQDVLFFMPHHASSNRPHSVHRNDVITLVELATSVRSLGGQPTLVGDDDPAPESGRFAEYCVGGPNANRRTAAYLRSSLPGIQAESRAASGDELTIWVGEEAYRRQPGSTEYALFVRLVHASSGRLVYLIIGQVAQANLAVARFLTRNHGTLRKRFGDSARFCVVFRVLDPNQFGVGHTEMVADQTERAFRPPVRS